jgi:hypothetical protein
MMYGKRSVLELGHFIVFVIMIMMTVMMMMMMVTATSAFTTIPPFALLNVQHSDCESRISSGNALYVASGGGGGGFGGGGGAAADKKKKKGTATASAALKPKQQWDRYGELKREDKVRVAIRIVGEKEGEEGDGDWIDVGRIKSKDNLYTEIAVARQRALIAEVSSVHRIGQSNNFDAFCRLECLLSALGRK